MLEDSGKMIPQAGVVIPVQSVLCHPSWNLRLVTSLPGTGRAELLSDHRPVPLGWQSKPDNGTELYTGTAAIADLGFYWDVLFGNPLLLGLKPSNRSWAGAQRVRRYVRVTGPNADGHERFNQNFSGRQGELALEDEKLRAAVFLHVVWLEFGGQVAGDMDQAYPVGALKDTVQPPMVVIGRQAGTIGREASSSGSEPQGLAQISLQVSEVHMPDALSCLAQRLPSAASAD